MKYIRTGNLYCFSPPVMIATFLIEIVSAIWVAIIYSANTVTRLVTAILACLAIFQLAEFNVCTTAFGISSLDWARVGFASITMLPPLGVHLAHRLANDKHRRLVSFSYVAAFVFAGLFLFMERGMQSEVCGGNYVIFHTAPMVWPVYALYYYGLLTAGVSYALLAARDEKHPNIIRSLRWLAFGYLSFMVPTTLVNIIDPATIAGIPSIMCGFAILLAVILVAVVMPNYDKTTDVGRQN